MLRTKASAYTMQPWIQRFKININIIIIKRFEFKIFKNLDNTFFFSSSKAFYSTHKDFNMCHIMFLFFFLFTKLVNKLVIVFTCLS